MKNLSPKAQKAVRDIIGTSFNSPLVGKTFSVDENTHAALQTLLRIPPRTVLSVVAALHNV